MLCFAIFDCPSKTQFRLAACRSFFMSFKDLRWFCKWTIWLRTAEKLHANLCKSRCSYETMVKLAPNQRIFCRSYAIGTTNVTCSNPMSLSTGIILKIIFCVFGEPRVGENLSLTVGPRQRKPGEKGALLFPTMLLLAFHMAKGGRIVPSKNSWAAVTVCTSAAAGMDVSEVAGDEGNFVICRRA